MTEHEGLPVSGYRAQPETAVLLVNANKEAEERVLRLLDGYVAMDKVDKRWLAIGRTAIEQGFMAVNRAIFKPSRVELPDETKPAEGGWLIEDGDSPPSAPRYFCAHLAAGAHCPSFDPDNLKALCFARKEDAEAFVIMSQGSIAGVRIAWHEWA